MSLLLDRIRSILEDNGLDNGRLAEVVAEIEECLEVDRIALVARAETAEAMLRTVQRQYTEALEKLRQSGGNIYD